MTPIAAERMRAADAIEKEQVEKQRAHHAEIKALKSEIDAQNSRIRVCEADSAKLNDKLKKREVEV
jgi:predicted nuclease with TOPRIM domain